MQDPNVGVQHIESQLGNLHMELQSQKTGKEALLEVCTEDWGIKCKDKGHDKDDYPIYQNYLIVGGHVPLKPKSIVGSSARVSLWCDIFQIARKHVTDHCHLLQKFIQTQQHFFCTFYKLVGHDE